MVAVFGWLKKRAMHRHLKGDTETTLRAVVALPLEVQQQCARTVLDGILAALADIEKTAGSARDDAMKEHLKNAMANRHLAVAQGARDHSDPLWAKYALLESWLLANTGEFGQQLFELVDAEIMAWLRATLTDGEIDEAMQRIGGDGN